MKEALKYICNPEKTNNGQMVLGFNCPPDYQVAYDSFQFVKQDFSNEDGRLAYHWEISFAPGETHPAQVMEIAKAWADEILGDEFQCLIAIHDDKEHIHAHLIFNSVSMIDGHKFRYEKNDLERIYYPALNRLCMERGLSIIELEAEEGEKVKRNISYKEWLMQKKGYPTWREMIKEDVDTAVSMAYSYENLLIVLENMGYDVNDSGKHLKVRVPGMEKWARTYTIGEGYDRDGLKYRLEYGSIKRPKKPVRYYAKKGSIKRQTRPLTYYERLVLYYTIKLKGDKRRSDRKLTFMQSKEAQKIKNAWRIMNRLKVGDSATLAMRMNDALSNLEDLKVTISNFEKQTKKKECLFSAARMIARFSDRPLTMEEAAQLESAKKLLQKHGIKSEEDLKEVHKMREEYAGKRDELRSNKQRLKDDIADLEFLRSYFDTRIQTIEIGGENIDKQKDIIDRQWRGYEL